MKKRLLILFVASTLTILKVSAQAVLPTSWNFATTTLPTGWSETNTNIAQPPYYPSSGNPAPAYRMDNDADLLTIFFNSTPGSLTYDLAGNSFAGGTFKTQQSNDGTTWTDLRTLTSLSTSYVQFVDVLASSTRYVRFNYVDKVTGNVGVDNISISVGVSTAQEISVKNGSTTIVNGGIQTISAAVSATTTTTFSVFNTGLSTLNISTVTLTGADAADFSIVSFPTSLTSNTNQPLIFDFTPAAAGTRNAQLHIANDDVNANPFIINLYGVGDGLASEPGTPTALSFTGGSNYVKTFRIKGSFAVGSPAIDATGGYLILRKTGASTADAPVDGTDYTRGDMVGAYQVVQKGTSLAFISSSAVLANTAYNFKVFAYNGMGSARNYSSEINLDVTTPQYTVDNGSSTIVAEYTAINTAAATFVADLKNRVRNPAPFSQFYSNYASTMIDRFTARDTVGGNKAITCVYSGTIITYTGAFSFGATQWSREHTFAHSWMPTNPADGSGAAPNNVERPEYNDQHHLFPTVQNGVNDLRCNYPFGEVVTVETNAGLGKLGLDANGKRVFEPKEEHKGDVARALFYMCLRYDGINDANGVAKAWNMAAPNGKVCFSTLINYNQDQDLLKTWHQMDPPSAFEISRNDFLDSLQKNRNPFVDHPEYACNIDFNTMTKITNATAVTNCTTPNDMIFSSAQYTEAETVSVNSGSTRNQVLRVSINTVGATPALTLTQVNFNTTGTTTPSADISKAELFSTGSSTTFATTTQYGSAVTNPSGAFSVSGSQSLLTGGNIFWLTYDIPAAQGNNNHVVNASLVSVVLNTGTQNGTLIGAVSGRTIVNTTSISELENGEKLVLAPNPSSSVFTITYSNLSNDKSFTYRVIDITGKEVLSNKTSAVSGLNIYPVDVTSIAKGLYFVECTVGDKKVTSKIIIE